MEEAELSSIMRVASRDIYFKNDSNYKENFFAVNSKE